MLPPYAPRLIFYLKAQLKFHLFNSFNKDLHRPCDKVSLGSPANKGDKKTSYFSMYKGPGGRKRAGTLEELEAVWCGEATQCACPQSGEAVGFDGLRAADNMVWCDHSDTTP